MSELRQILKDVERQFGLDQCTACIRPTQMKDALGFPWCEEHEHHGTLISWAYRHKYPEIRFPTYPLKPNEAYWCVIGPGEIDWWNKIIGSAATGSNKGDEELMWTALIYVEYLDSTEEKAS